MSATIKCDFCAERADAIYSSNIVLKAGYDIQGAAYCLCSTCAVALRDFLDGKLDTLSRAEVCGEEA